MRRLKSSAKMPEVLAQGFVHLERSKTIVQKAQDAISIGNWSGHVAMMDINAQQMQSVVDHV